jgi:hypothetical protein
MMRIFSAGVLMFAIAAQAIAGITVLSRFGPTLAASQVTIAAPGAGKRNCLSSLDVVSDTAYTLRVLDGTTTSYALALAANGGLVRSWDTEDLFCGSANAAMYITVSAGTYSINYKGFVY